MAQVSPNDSNFLLPFAKKENTQIVEILQKLKNKNSSDEDINVFLNQANKVQEILTRCANDYGQLKDIGSDISDKIREVYDNIHKYLEKLKNLESGGSLFNFISQFRLRFSLEQLSNASHLCASNLEAQIRNKKMEAVRDNTENEFSMLLNDIEKSEPRSIKQTFDGKSSMDLEKSIKNDSTKQELENMLSLVSDPLRRENLLNSIRNLKVKPLANGSESSVWSGKENDDEEKFPNDFICAQTISNYPKDSSGIREGDPICDQYCVTRWENRIAAAVADGCSWGIAPKEAARKVSRMFLAYMKKNQHLITTTRDAASMILRAFMYGHKSIIHNRTEEDLFTAGTTTVLGGIVLELDEPYDNNKFIFVCASIGDCKSYLYSSKSSSIREITIGNRGNIDPRDPGGRLGPTLENGAPDLRNLKIYAQPCDTDDFLVIVSDGVHDNLDPRQLGFLPNDLGLSLTNNSWDQFKDFIPPEVEDKLHKWIEGHINKLIQKPISPQTIVKDLIQYSVKTTEPIRKFITSNPGKRVPNDYKLFPGKLDHTTCVCVKVGIYLKNSWTKASIPQMDMNTSSPEDIWNKLFGSETIIAWKIFIQKLGIQVSKEEEKQLKTLLDYHGTETITLEKFSPFLKGFGPFDQCIKNASRLISAEWFQGFLTRAESKRFLETQPSGTFLVRLSGTKVGTFALDYVANGVHSVRLDFHENGGWVAPLDGEKKFKAFKSIHEIIETCTKSKILAKPFSSPLLNKRWFYGDCTAEDAEELLKGQPPGTFIIRFSKKKGHFAASFVDQQTQSIKKALITSQDGYRVEGQGTKFLTLDEMVSFYKKKGVFVSPPVK